MLSSREGFYNLSRYLRRKDTMAKYKPYTYAQNMLIPVSLNEQLMPGSLEHAIHTLVDERMDVSLFDEKYKNDDTGRRAYDPRILLKVVLLGYSRGAYIIEEDRAGLQGERGVHGTELRTVS